MRADGLRCIIGVPIEPIGCEVFKLVLEVSAYLGELRSLRARQAELLAEAAERGNLLSAACVSSGPANIGCPEYVSVNQLVETVAAVAGKHLRIRHIDGPVGVHSRNFSNARIESLGWHSSWPLRRGIEATYPWIAAQVAANPSA